MKLYTNGNIITMVKDMKAEAVLTCKDKILAVGTKERLLKLSKDAEIIDLNGCTMMPGFIDAHSHISSYATSFMQVSLDKCSSFSMIQKKISSFISDNKVLPGEFVIAKGYDNNILKEKVNPSLATLDDFAPNNPLVIQYVSGHAGIFNSLALKALNISSSTESIEGGKIEIKNGKPTGFLEENAFFKYIKMVPMPSLESIVKAYIKAQNVYASYGITTIQEGMMVEEMILLYKYLIDNKIILQDVIGYMAIKDAKKLTDSFKESIKKYNSNFKIGGIKIFLDGSPQGRTAWMRTPYLNEEPKYYGYGTMKDKEVIEAISYATNNNIQIIAHCNGDAASEQYLSSIEKVNEDMDVSSLRPVMIHAQLLGIDQLKKVKSLSVIPSFFVAHVYHFGDTHIKNFGIKRASLISPANSAIKENIMFTFHQDSPVIEPNMLETVWCAVNRITSSNVLLGAEERISVIEALKAITINAAYQYFEENHKGSIEEGKNADFVVLDKDPLSINKMDINKIKIIKTIKNGRVIFEA